MKHSTEKKLKYLKNTLAITIFVVAGVSRAVGDTLSQDAQIYQETLGRCQQTVDSQNPTSRIEIIWRSFDIEVFRESATQGLMVVTLDPGTITELLHNNGLSPRLYATLNSPGFEEALSTCYGNDRASRSTFIAGLVASEVAGRTTAIAVVAASVYVTGSIVLALSAWKPILAKFFLAGSIGFSSYTGYRIYCANYCEPTDEEKQIFQKKFEAVSEGPLKVLNQALFVIDRRIDELIEKLNVSTGNANVELASKLEVILEKRDRLEFDLAGLSLGINENI